MANLAFQPGVIEFFDSITKAGSVELAVQEVILPATSPLAGKTLAEAQNTLGDHIMIVAVKKAGRLITGSRQEARIEEGDTIIVVGDPEKLTVFKEKNRKI